MLPISLAFASAMTHWTPAALAFGLAFLYFANLYAYLDHTQPFWYHFRAVSPYRHQLVHFREWLHLNLYALRNIILAYLAGLALYTLRFTLFVTDTNADLSLLDLTNLLICYPLGSELFGVLHWLVHRNPTINHLVHSLHHSYHKPIALVGLYASILEMFLINIPLGVLPPLIMNLSPIGTRLYTALLALYISTNHSGHQLVPLWLIDVSYHDIHHRRATENYGSIFLE